ncbi:Hypothetical protein A7982_10016 [Minicystis rosea]|nr:Hypothetical protein A7982_10016 [Minicystis rosea]
MRRVTTWAMAAALGIATITAQPARAFASPKPKVEWVRVDVPEGLDTARLGKVLKDALKQAAKRADFGKAAKTVSLSARIVEMKTEQQGDVLRVTCTVSGRVAGSSGARSRISYGGSPDKREELEKSVLTMVANGLVARLAQIVRTQPPKVR